MLGGGGQGRGGGGTITSEGDSTQGGPIPQ